MVEKCGLEAGFSISTDHYNFRAPGQFSGTVFVTDPAAPRGALPSRGRGTRPSEFITATSRSRGHPTLLLGGLSQPRLPRIFGAGRIGSLTRCLDPATLVFSWPIPLRWQGTGASPLGMSSAHPKFFSARVSAPFLADGRELIP